MCKIPDDMKWSFSKQQLYDQCPLAFKQQYIDKVPQEENAYAEYGTHCHSLLERWAKGELMSFELADAYEAEYDEAVKHYFPPFPKGMSGQYYDEGLQYFRSFDGFGGDKEILSVEDKFELDIRGNRFVGIADLVLQDKKTGDIIVIDHKSKSMNSMKKAQYENTRQLYTYAAYVKEHFGEFPTLLQFNMFRQRFVHVGFGNMLCANRVVVILSPGTACAKRQLKNAKEHKLHFDLSFGRTTKALILLEDGMVISCALTPRTIAGRIDAIPNEGDNENEDHQADGQDTGAD